MLSVGPLKDVLQSAYDMAGKEAVLDRYLDDFVRMVYNAGSSEDEVEYQVL